MSAKAPRLVRLGVLASGRGSNLQAIIDAIEQHALSAEIAVVLSNKQEAVALERARKHGAPAVWLDPKPFAGRPDSREAYDRAVQEVLQKHEVDLVLLGPGTDPLLLYEIFMRGMPLFEARLGAFQERRLLAWKIYLDTAPLRELERDYVKRADERRAHVS